MQSATRQTDIVESPGRRFPLWLIALGSGLFAGLLAAFAGEFTFEAIHAEPQYPASFSSLTSSERAVARGVVRFETRKTVGTKQATAAYGLLGLALGAALGFSGGLAGGSRSGSVGGAIVGGVSGGLLGAGLSIALFPLFFESSDGMAAVPLLFLTFLAIFAGVGAAGGLAFGWGWGDRKVIVRCMLGGLVGALVGTFVFELTNAVAFGIMRLFEPVPAKTMPRFVVHLGVAFGAALGVGFAARKVRPRQA